MSIRPAGVAGSFYPGSATKLRNYLNQIVSSEEKRRNKKISPRHIIGGIVPHAGYKYAAKEAVHFFDFFRKSKETVETFLIINPSHSGAEHDISLDTHEAWNTPLGNVQLDTEFMDTINLPRSADAQRGEHSAEVIIPYLQFFLNYKFKIVPITMLRQNYKNARMLAEKIYKAKELTNRKIALIASTDFSHYEKPEMAFYNDNLVINRILDNSIRGLYDTIRENKISVCGYGPIMTLMFFSRMVYANYQVEILARGNSSEKSDDHQELVVDYVSALFYS